MSLHTVEAMLRGPLKRLRQQPVDSDGNGSELSLDSLKRQKCSFLDEERENVNPVESVLTTSKNFRALEQEIKPDTPVVPSVKSRLHRLAEQRKAWDSEEFSPGTEVSLGMKNGQVSPEETGNSSWKDELTRPAIKKVRKETEERVILSRTKEKTTKVSSIAVQSVRERFEEMNHEKQNQEGIGSCCKIIAITPSTKHIQAMLLHESTPSAAHVIRMKKEREQELAVLQGKTEGNNPWVGMKTSRFCTGLKQTGKGLKGSTESQENTIHGSDATSNFEHSEKYEDVLRITEGEESSSQEDLNHPEIIDKLFEGILYSDSMDEEIEPQAKEQMMTELKKSNAEEQSDEVKPDAEAEPKNSKADEQAELSNSNAEEQSDEVKSEAEAEPKKSRAEEQAELKKSRAEEKHDIKSEVEAEDQKDDDELMLPSISMLSPLAKSIKLDGAAPLTAVLSSLNNSLTESCCSPYSSLELNASGQNQDRVGNLSPVVESTPFYSIDLYRTQRRSARLRDKKNVETKKVITPRATESSWLTTQQMTTKEKIKVLNDEIIRLNSIMHQASQALNCCTDEEHGKGSREEAEAERHLLIASEKRTALLTELKKLKGEGNAVSLGETTRLTNGLEPCRGTISISDLRLPLKAEFVCSALHKQGKPSHYFLLMIRYGPHNIVATSLATAEDAQHGDTITFPTIITLRDIHYKFEIDLEVYSLAHAANVATSEKRRVSRSKVITPKKLLTSITKSSMQSPAASPAVASSVRTSKFVLVGSHKITLASLGKDKFPLDKMKFDGKVRQLLGDEFQDKVPFLSPLEGAIYLKLQCHFHSSVEHSGFLTMFEDVSGFGAWHRRWFLLSGNTLSYWTYPNEEKHKKPIGCIDLASCTKDKIEPASREFCSRPKTFELITVRPQCEDDHDTLIVQCRNKMCFTKNWLSADTKEERNLWMGKLNQVLINLGTWQLTLQSSVSVDGI
ncbi:anillin-like isoform X2 [Carcharodon carcharias]|uniref:anillin-like isoform X2 n=1 Tax=Carcharodon carcharias TaxID=13397 RepID=UPI001B7F08AE|nr:anillin-like isoform X2 [Carcharodon carcharias]